MTTGEKLVLLRRKHSLSQIQLAALSGVPVTTISGIENTTKIPRLETAAKIAKVFDLHAEDLLVNDDPTLMAQIHSN